MKKQLIALLAVAALSAVAFAGPMVSPYFEIENVGIAAAPTLEFGALLEADIADGWDIDLGGFYFDNNILNANDKFDLGFVSSLSFDNTLMFLNGDSLDIGGSLSLGSVSTFNAGKYPNKIKLVERSSAFLLSGLLGPLSVWGGIEFPWDGAKWLDLVPTLGIRLELGIPLEKPSTKI